MLTIAEIGLNHCGSIDRANNLVDDLLCTSVDYITFQIREKEFYDGSHPRKIELPIKFYKNTVKKIHKSGKKFGVSISQIQMIEEFIKIGTDFWKTLSWDLTNYELQNALQKTNKTVFISTGISSAEEIIEETKLLNNIVLIHTQLDYSLNNANLKAISTMRNKLNRDIEFN